MKPQDYYHRIALAAREIADDHEQAARDSDRGTKEEERVKADIREAAETAGRHSLFTEELGGIWTVSTMSADDAALMGEIIEVSRYGFHDKVEGRPSKVLREGAATTMVTDVEKGAFRMLRHRMADE